MAFIITTPCVKSDERERIRAYYDWLDNFRGGKIFKSMIIIIRIFG